MNNRTKEREKLSVSLDIGTLERIREIMKIVQVNRIAAGKKTTSLSRMIEAAIKIGLRDEVELEEYAGGVSA
jgi:hypothetical protein